MDVLKKGRWVTEAPGNTLVRGYHLSRLYSPWANIPAMIVASQSPTPRRQQEFLNSDLGEPFVLEGGGLTLDLLDRCRDDYALGEYAGERCVMGIDVGTKLHVVIRELSERRARTPAAARRLWFAATVDTFEELDALMLRFNVAGVVIDAQPEVRKTAEFARRHANNVRVAWYGRQDPGFERISAQDGRPSGFRLNRLEALERTFLRFRDRSATLPGEARRLGGGLRRGHGEYYRRASGASWTLEQDVQGNWRERWFDGGQPDHFAHAEVYCLFAEEIVPPRLIDIEALNRGLERPSPFPGGNDGPWDRVGWGFAGSSGGNWP